MQIADPRFTEASTHHVQMFRWLWKARQENDYTRKPSPLGCGWQHMLTYCLARHPALARKQFWVGIINGTFPTVLTVSSIAGNLSTQLHKLSDWNLHLFAFYRLVSSVNNLVFSFGKLRAQVVFLHVSDSLEQQGINAIQPLRFAVR